MMRRTITLVACLVVGLVVLAGCGISTDRVPRDVDPEKHEELNTP